MSEGTFATAIICMDGRIQLPVNEWMRDEFDAAYIDTITEAGPNGLLARGELEESIRERTEISVRGHGSTVIAVAGHHDCAGHPVSEEKHREDVKKAVERVAGWGLDAEVVGIWLGPDWEVEEIVRR